MKPYEAVIIFNPALTEEKIDSAVAKFEKKIKESGGADISVSKWGMKKLAARLKKAKKSNEGYYVLINFDGGADTPNKLRSLLNISEDVIRYSVICSRVAGEIVKEEKVEIEPSMLEGKA